MRASQPPSRLAHFPRRNISHLTLPSSEALSPHRHLQRERIAEMEDDSNHQNTTTTTATTTITTNNNNDDAVNNNDALVLTPRVTVDQLTGWVSAAVVSAFFSSLERFSCVNVTTADLDDDDDDDYEGDGEGSKRSLDSGNSSVGDDPPPRNDVANVSV